MFPWHMSGDWCGDKRCSGGAISWCDVDGSGDGLPGGVDEGSSSSNVAFSMDAGGEDNGVYAGFVVLTFDVEYDEDDGLSSSKLVFSFDGDDLGETTDEDDIDDDITDGGE